MTDAVATAAGIPIDVVRRAAMLSGDLGRTAALALTEGREALEAVRLAVLHPIQPMLAASAADVTEALGHTGPASVEWKLDGARVQVHRLGDEVRIYTRNLNDITDRLAGVVALARGLPVTSVVLDGEVLGVHEDATPQAFQDTMSAFGRDGASGAAAAPARALLRHPPPRRRRPHRRAARRRGCATSTRWSASSPSRGSRTADPAEAQALLDERSAHGHEGAMVKALDSTYDAGRRGGSWRKVKPVKTLDLVVLAAEWGSGRRQGWLSNLHLGARDPDGGFVMVGKTFKGLTDELLDLADRGAPRAGGPPRRATPCTCGPSWSSRSPSTACRPARRYPGGVALRFARVRGYRPDKDPEDADLITTVQAMRAGSS